MANYQFPSNIQSWTSISDNGASNVNDILTWDSGNGYPVNGSIKIVQPDSLGSAPTLYYSTAQLYSPGSLGITPTIGNNFSFFYKIENRAAYSQDFLVYVITPNIAQIDNQTETLTIPASTTSDWAKFTTTFIDTITLDQVAIRFRNTTDDDDDGYFTAWLDNVYVDESDPMPAAGDIVNQPSQGGIPGSILVA